MIKEKELNYLDESAYVNSCEDYGFPVDESGFENEEFASVTECKNYVDEETGMGFGGAEYDIYF